MIESTSNAILIGVDVGGTFTDVVMVRGRDILLEKVLTTLHDPSIAILEGCMRALRRMNVLPKEVALIVHATTIVTNALIERKGAITGLLATKGFRDVLEIGKEQRYHIFDLDIDKPPPLIPRSFRRGVTGRILADGTVFEELNVGEVLGAVQDMVTKGAESLAVCLLHSYVNSTHEEKISQLVADHFPLLDVSLSSQVAPEIREWERMSTTAANAYVRPLCKLYLQNLSHKLREAGIQSDFHVMVSSGGIASADMARSHPVRLMESGPAAGVMAASYYGKLLGSTNLIAFDMGGTTAKICLITDGKPRRARGFEAARVDRFQRGSGLPIKIPVIELIEIGAGGGSIARADPMGLLKVGPESAGAYPGPACYGFGGIEATVTDADLILGYLNPHYFLGGTMNLDVSAAERALSRLGDRLVLSKTETAQGIFRVVNENMSTATRVHAAEQGEDPRKYDLMAFGGAGPVHAYEIARNLKIRRIICPIGAGTLSALGLLVAPRAVEFAQTYAALLDKLNWEQVRDIFGEMHEKANAVLLQTGVRPGEIQYHFTADMRYRGQGFEIEVPVEPAVLESGDTLKLAQSFETMYLRLFRRTVPNGAIESMTWRFKAEASPHVTAIETAITPKSGNVHKGRRQVFFPELTTYMEAQVLDRYRMRPDDHFDGPCVVEEGESTVVVGPSAYIDVDVNLDLILSLNV